jgi:hypothetical protein
MFLLGELLFGSVFHLFEAFLPFVIIGLIVSLIVRNSKGKQTAYGYVKPGEALMEGTDPNAKVSTPNNATSLNILLYVGSFLIVGAILLLIKDEPKLVPFITIFATIVAYAAGILIYRFVEYLRPVATAFTYTSMILFPLWYYAFTEIGLASEVALFISTIITFFAYAGAAVGIDSRMAGWLSYIWFILCGWTGASMIDAHASRHAITTYAFFIWPLIAAIFPTICWSCRVKWLPVAYRKATKFFAQWLTPIFALFTLLTIATPNIASECPALRIIASSLAVAISLIGWLANKKDRVLLVSLRIYLHMLILMIVADATNYSLHFGKAAASDVAIVITWLIGWLGQTICSLFIPQRTESDKSIEKSILAFSLVGIFSTWFFCFNFDQIPYAIILIAIVTVITILGALIGWRYKNISWLNASVLGVMAIPLITFSELMPSGDHSWAIFTTYTILTMIFIGLYAVIKNIQPQRSLGVVTTATVTGSVVCIIALASNDLISLGWLLAAIDMALVSVIAKKYAMLEWSAYLAAVSLSSFIGQFNKWTSESSLTIVAVQAHIIALPLIIFGFFKERSTSGARKVLGFLALALTMFFIASGANLASNYAVPLIAIFDYVAFIILGVFAKHQWMYITSSVLLVITTLELTGGFNGIWLLLIGIGLIVFVAFQLTKNAKKQQ